MDLGGIKGSTFNPINTNIITEDHFNSSVEKIVKNESISYIDAIIKFCSQRGIEIDSVKPLVSQSIKNKLECEFADMRYLKAQPRLPF